MRGWGFWIFLHLLGMALWLGGMFTVSIWTLRARGTGEPKIVAFTYATARWLYQRVIAPGATLTVVAGAILMIMTSRPWVRPFPEHWLFQMQVLGTLAFLATVSYLLPNAGVLARLAERAADVGEHSPEFPARVRIQAIVGSLVGALLIYMVLLGGLRF